MARPTATMQQWVKAAQREIAEKEANQVPEVEEVEKLCARCGRPLIQTPWDGKVKCIWSCDNYECTIFRRPQVRELGKRIVPEVEGLARRR